MAPVGTVRAGRRGSWRLATSSRTRPVCPTATSSSEWEGAAAGGAWGTLGLWSGVAGTWKGTVRQSVPPLMGAMKEEREEGYGYGYGYILGPSPVPPIYLSGSFGLVRPAWI